MFWADKIAKNIIDSGKYKPYWVDDMKTPSGRIHVGSLRGVLTHELVWRALKHAGKTATFSYVFEDHDPMDELPFYLSKEKWSQYLGQPLFTVPSPEPEKAANYAQYFSLEFKEVFNKIGAHPKIIWTSELYKTGKMNDDIKTCLSKVKVIRNIYEEIYKKPLRDDWYPFQVVCPNCQKESTTQVYKWDGEFVYFTCKTDAVPWTKGCGYKGKTTPFSTDGKFVGKLPYKVEWAVKWKVIGITVEGAGKDHMTAGGSHDVSQKVCERVINYPTPYGFSHEFFLIEGKKMSSSKGLGSSAKEISEILPPYLLRFLFTRADYREAINFDPIGNMSIPDLFDEYDRCWEAYNKDSDKTLSRIYEYCQLDGLPPKNPKLFMPRFRDIANYIQHPAIEIQNKFEEIKGEKLTKEEMATLAEREKYAQVWVKKYAPDEYRLHMTEKLPGEVSTLTEKQKEYLGEIVGLLGKYKNPADLQLALYNLAKELKLDSKDAFTAIYTAFLGKKHGPKAAWFLLQYPKEKIIQRLKQVSGEDTSDGGRQKIKTPRGWQAERSEAMTPPMVKESQTTFSRPDLFIIDDAVKTKYPSVSIGIALIKNVKILKSHPELEKEKQEFLVSLKGLTTEELGKLSEVISYRRLYKEMGIDWHSRRPSPEALLRRAALKKGLYTINTCVDAYNLVVMKHRVSVGAFDLDKFKFPTVLRFSKKGEEILLLGDEIPTKYTEKELAYFDQIGGYNIDFNFRDAQRTAVTPSTKNLFINVDGVYDITPTQVEKSLKEAIEIIIQYCGGDVEMQGIVI